MAITKPPRQLLKGEKMLFVGFFVVLVLVFFLLLMF